MARHRAISQPGPVRLWLARRAAEEGADVVLACGGDGTLNEAINGLAGTDTLLATFPGGTVNVWAREVGIPADPVEAIRDE